MRLLSKSDPSENHGRFSGRMWRWKECSPKARLAPILLVLHMYPTVSFAQVAPPKPTGPEGGPQLTELHSATPPLTKFEARRIRHRCQDQAGGSSSNRDVHLRHCFEMHVAARRLWSQCKHKFATVNLHGREKDEAIRRCVLEALDSSKKGQPIEPPRR